MRATPRALSRADLAALLRDDAPAVAARLADATAPAPEVRAVLHPRMHEADDVRSRLRALGLTSLCEAIAAMEADDTTVRALARKAFREAEHAPQNARSAHDLALFGNELFALAHSRGWIRCDPRAIANTRFRIAWALHASTALQPEGDAVAKQPLTEEERHAHA